MNMMNSIERISAVGVSAPAGHYSHATAWHGLVFASGQLGARGDGSHTADQPFETQVRQALDNVLTVLAEAGCGPEQVLRVTAYIVGVENWPAFNRVYAEAFGSAKPARTVVPVAGLHHGYLVEIEAIGVRHSSE
jgi:2-iminobutanoate/2-iminopropanoate deaminase